MSITYFRLPNELSPDQYLEMSLNKGNHQCNVIKKFFPRRKCFAFKQPCGDEHFEQLHKTDIAGLRPEFVKEVDKLKEFIKNDGNFRQFLSTTFPTLLNQLWESIINKDINLENFSPFFESGKNVTAMLKVVAILKEKFKEIKSYPGRVIFILNFFAPTKSIS